MPPPSSGRDDGALDVGRILPGGFAMGGDYDMVRPRGTVEWVLIFTVDGSGCAWGRGGTAVRIPPRSIVAFTPHTPQHYGTDPAVGSWDLLWAHVRPGPHWPALLDWPAAAPGILRLDLDPFIADRVEAALRSAVAHHRAGLTLAPAFAMNAVEQALLWCSTQNPRHDDLDPAVLAVIEYVSARLDQAHTVASLAAVAGLSPSRLAHVFTARTGMSLMAQVQRMRMDAAKELLELTNLGVAQVAARVGFTDPLYFSRRFRIATGLAPSDYRAQHPSTRRN
ncbi:helix-turn-helix domain-containing protein [Streptomyces boninensis]|uniref:helix-turn-helix domain-containing protein n=1 Tax=Streptomyces boninensis TaxID=2039455 RepID=UPI003B222E03